MSKAAELANLIGNINAGGGGVNKNAIINGAMNCSQRAVSFSFADATYCLDRFVMGKGNSSGAATITQDSSAPDGFSNSLKVDVTTADTSLAVNHIDQILHRIEAQNLQQLAFGTSSAKNFTLSFYVKSNKTGNYSVNIGQQDNSYKQANLLYTINSANTWERKSLTFTGDTSGVINDDNGSGFEIAWILAAGTTYTSGSNSASFSSYANANYAANHGVNVFDSTDNTWFLTGVQLEIGQNATEFEHEPIERTLDKCRRYTFVMGGDGIYERFAVGYQQSSTQARCVTFYPTTMRANPTTSKTDPLIVAHRSTAQSVSSISVDYNSKTVGHIQYNVSSGLNAGEGCHIVANNNANARLTFDAEL
tara:strand:- start:474 stop:1565 length:1092 start_codon:yes stop_codon:yes gene_type:complete